MYVYTCTCDIDIYMFFVTYFRSFNKKKSICYQKWSLWCLYIYIYIFQIHWIWKCICVHMHRPVKYVRINIFSTGHVEEIQQKRVCNILELTKLCAFSSTCVNTVNPSFYLDKTHLMIQLNNFKRGSAKGVH